MIKHPNKLWITVLLLGWFFDFLFWKHLPGINFAIFVVLCLVGGMVVLFGEGFKPSRRSLLLLIPILFFAAISFIRREDFTNTLSIFLTLLLLALIAATWLGGRWLEYGLADYFLAALRLVGGVISKPFMLLTSGRSTSVAAGESRPVKRNFWPVVRGILIALPILVIFASLLASADLVFSQKLQAFISLFNLERLPEYILRLFIILAGAFLLAGVFLHAAASSRDEKLAGADKPLVPAFLGMTETGIILGSLALLFTLFVVVQFQYFFGGQANIHLDGFTYAEYARKGFGELVAVAAFSLLLLMVLSSLTRRDTTIQRNVFSALGVLLLVLVGVILISAFQRLVLYENAYGFSRLRTYTHVFMIWLGILLAVVVLLEVLHKERVFTLAAFLALLGFVASLSLVNVDGYIASQNIQRASQGQELDVPYLSSLSTDAIPDLVRIFSSPNLKPALHEQVGATLVCLAQYNGITHDQDWRAFNVSRAQANRLLSSIKVELDAYPINTNATQPFVQTPSGARIPCFSSSASMD